jgi:hypothetical protein
VEIPNRSDLDEVMGSTHSGPPEKLRIPYEDWEGGRFCDVGRCADGRQFLGLVTGAFSEGDKLWLAVLHLFDADGNHLASEARLGGYDEEGWEVAGDKARGELELMLQLMGPEVRRCDLYVRLFATEIDGITHGLFYAPAPDNDGGCESVMLEPREILFVPPWDSGKYWT